jgi:hypothetical protein
MGRRRDACASLVHGGINSPAEGNGMTIRIRYRILNARLVAGAVSGSGVDQAYDGWREVCPSLNFSNGWKAEAPAVLSTEIDQSRHSVIRGWGSGSLLAAALSVST